jgi:hypothetical protein
MSLLFALFRPYHFEEPVFLCLVSVTVIWYCARERFHTYPILAILMIGSLLGLLSGIALSIMLRLADGEILHGIWNEFRGNLPVFIYRKQDLLLCLVIGGQVASWISLELFAPASLRHTRYTE